MVRNAQPTICIVYPGGNEYSETFIRAHIERLPAQITLLAAHTLPLPAPLLLLYKGLRSVGRGDSRTAELAHSGQQKVENGAIKRFLKRNAVDVVLAEYGMHGAFVMDACVQADIPLVVHFHGYDAYREDAVLQYYRTDYQRMFQVARAVIAVSHDMECQLASLGAPAEKIIYSPCGVDTTLFTQTDSAANPPLFVAVGRFVDKKAPYLTLVAFNKVVQQCPEARLVMVGDGILWEACKTMVQSWGLAESISLPGSLPHTEVAAMMRRARAFVQHSVRTSYGDSEGTPVAVLEAGASGLPVVSTRHAGIKDVVIEGETGFLVDEGDIEGMAAHMLTLARDADLAGRMGRRAREHVAANFSMEQHIARLAEVLEGAAQRNPT
jgi:glycosyltransferase involved in cell wall biosynthesis